MEVICKTTPEVTDQEIDEIYDLFENVFEIKRSRQAFREEYENTPLGLSYHSILKDKDNRIVGFHSCMPFYYIHKGKKFIAALGIDSMVAPEHRDFFGFRDMIRACEKRLAEEGCDLRFGFPNDNSYPVLKRGLKYKDIGKLSTYCLIRNIGAAKSSLAFANPLTRIFAWLQIKVSHLSKSTKEFKFPYHKDYESFNNVRYKWFGGEYQKVRLGDFDLIYKVKNHEGVETAFVLDVFPLSKANFDKAIRYIYKNESDKVDMVLYVGNLPFTPLSMIKIPHKFEPKHFNFTCKMLNKGKFDDSIYDIDNWDVNLSNYDLL